jgi:hypothetical protein
MVPSNGRSILAHAAPAWLQVSDFNLSKILEDGSAGSSVACSNPRWWVCLVQWFAACPTAHLVPSCICWACHSAHPNWAPLTCLQCGLPGQGGACGHGVCSTLQGLVGLQKLSHELSACSHKRRFAANGGALSPCRLAPEVLAGETHTFSSVSQDGQPCMSCSWPAN